MAHIAEDYYDMPVELLPSANFAGRPTSDIDMLPALWTLAAYSFFEKDQVDTEISPRLQNSTAPQPKPAVVEAPCTTITVPLTEEMRSSKSPSSGVKALDRRRLRKKAQTPSPGGIDARSSPPFSPGRAGGARQGQSNTTRRTPSWPFDQVESAVVTRQLTRDARLGPQRALPEPPRAQCGEAISVCAKQRHSSRTHQTTRVLQRRAEAPLEMLDTALSEGKGSSSSAPPSPSSMVSTPQELYAIGGEEAMANETAGSAQLCGARSANEAAKITLAQTCSPSSRSKSGWGNALGPKQPRGDVDVADGRRIYLPGAMMLAACPGGQRRDSVATTPDAAVFDTGLGPLETRYSDLVGLDGIVTFFEDFGVVAEATEATLDRYWLPKCRGRRRHSSDTDRRTAGVSSVEGHDDEESQREAATQSHWIERRASTLSLSTPSASWPGAAVQRRAKRKRSRLRDLLSPGLPGTGYGKTPANWEHQASA